MHSPSLPTTAHGTSPIAHPASLTASGSICLHDHLRQLCAGRDELTLDDCLASLRAHLPSVAAVATRKQIAQILRNVGFVRHQDRTRIAYIRKDCRTAPATDPLPAHLNFTFKDWLRQRTERPRLPQGWMPGTKLYADYAEWCFGTQAPAEYVLGEAEFAGRLRAHDDRQPEIRKVSDGVRDSYALCFPRRLLPAIRV